MFCAPIIGDIDNKLMTIDAILQFLCPVLLILLIFCDPIPPLEYSTDQNYSKEINQNLQNVCEFQ